jgi:IstB-like ATP binding protein
MDLSPFGRGGSPDGLAIPRSQYTGKRRLIRVLMVPGEYLSSRPVLDELGYLPIDKRGSDLLFQVVAARYQVGSIVITTNRPVREWRKPFDVDNTLATALIDRLMHHGEGIVIQGDSYRMKDKDPDSTDE